MRTYFKADIQDNRGENWWLADFGVDENGKEYILTTNNVRASEAGFVSHGAKSDCELCAKLLNAYYNAKSEE